MSPQVVLPARGFPSQHLAGEGRQYEMQGLVMTSPAAWGFPHVMERGNPGMSFLWQCVSEPARFHNHRE